jgi:preprotein translocase subunit SecG
MILFLILIIIILIGVIVYLLIQKNNTTNHKEQFFKHSPKEEFKQPQSITKSKAINYINQLSYTLSICFISL